jgi:hypothetical protein
VIVAGLAPGARYRATLSLGNGCSLEVGEDRAGTVANAGGFLRLELSGCKRR